MQLQGQIIPDEFVKHSPSITGLQAGLDLLLHWDLRPELEQLTTPVCYMFGRLDAITPRATMTMMEKRYLNLIIIFSPKQHTLPFYHIQNILLMSCKDFYRETFFYYRYRYRLWKKPMFTCQLLDYFKQQNKQAIGLKTGGKRLL